MPGNGGVERGGKCIEGIRLALTAGKEPEVLPMTALSPTH